MSPFWITLLLSFALAWLIGIRLLSRHRLDLPSPKGGLWLLGHSLSVPLHQPWETFARWAKECGECSLIVFSHPVS